MSGLSSLAAPAEAEIKIQRSRFIAWVHPAEDASEARDLVTGRSRLFTDATHNCFAYVTGWQRETQYFSDAGEPSGTAGKPILNALLSTGLTNVTAVVTRYYGGIKLGVRGLIDAYGQAVLAVVNGAELIPAVPVTRYVVATDYALAEIVIHLAREMRGRLLDSDYGANVRLLIEVPQASDMEWRQTLDGLRARSGLEYIPKKEL